MSADFVVGFENAGLWGTTRGMLGWILETLAGSVTDADLAAQLRELADLGLGLVSFEMVRRDQVPEMIDAIRTSLVPAAEERFADKPNVVDHIREFVEVVAEWQAAGGK